MATSPKLDLTTSERQALRKCRIRLYSIALQTVGELAAATGIDYDRCEELVALAQFQTLGSVGLESARDLWVLGFTDLTGLRLGNPAEMYDRLRRRSGESLDSCVEDVLRCAVAQAREPDLPQELRNWWAWSSCRGESKIRIPDSPIEL